MHRPHKAPATWAVEEDIVLMYYTSRRAPWSLLSQIIACKCKDNQRTQQEIRDRMRTLSNYFEFAVIERDGKGWRVTWKLDTIDQWIEKYEPNPVARWSLIAYDLNVKLILLIV